MLTTTTAPRSAAEAAHQLAREGKHVHLISDGEPRCLKGCCYPTPVELPPAVLERARLARISMSFQIHRL
ncbi:hypothetical protein [Streptomyces sp. NPDC006333]|uniref:hypothetical protein n=1 Tax=Streptomyces sp. NPDC006333 TaxID=3156753 RepID=UPI00339E71D1